ncbi:MAG: c-type cytochrome domain-containing protein [Chitinophagaceae bacterium]
MRNSWVTYLLASLNLLLLFLAAFHSNLQLPTFLAWSGRLHPMLLHFPLALILVTVALQLVRLPPSTFHLLTFLSALTASTAALLGLFLSTSGEYDNDLLQKHLWLGVSISVLAFLFWLFRNTIFWKRLCMVLIVPVLILGSHYGASITHGEDYLDWPVSSAATQQLNITDSTAVYEALVQPILASKCYSCHNEKKAKGELIMTSVAALLKGGKNGPLWKPGDPLNSHMLQRAQLSEDDKKHMPPRGKPQLSAQELTILELWIAKGADLQKRFLDYDAADSFRLAMQGFIPKKAIGNTYSFEAASTSLIQSLQTPYMYISPVATGSPALSVRCMISSKFDPTALKSLEKIKEQIVEINLSGMPVNDEDLALLAGFEHLEQLILNNTSISGKGLAYLSKLTALKTLALSGTLVTGADLKILTAMPALKTVYCWNTKVDSSGIIALQPANKNIQWVLGYQPNQHEVLKLTTPVYVERDKPILQVGDTVRLKHPMPGVNIYYTLDGSAPDSLRSTKYPGYLVINQASRIRAIACRPGWLTSDTLEKRVWVQSTPPRSAKLNSPSDTTYKLLGGPSLVDGKIGDVNNFTEHWMGFHGTVCDLSVSFDKPMAFREVVVSTLKKTGPHIFPPSHLELWAGNDTLNMVKLSSYDPAIPDHYDQDRIDAQILPSKGSYQYYRLKIYPVKALPKWHDGKGKKVWIFIDEVFFN